MKAFYRITSLMCVFLAIFVLFSGTAGADDRRFANEIAFSDDIIEISAPSTIKAGEVANMTIRVPVPENATGTELRYYPFVESTVGGNVTSEEGPEIPEEEEPLVDIQEIIVSKTFGTDGKPVKFEFPKNATSSQ